MKVPRQIVCYRCNKTGHKKYSCPEKQRDRPPSAYKDGKRNGRGRWCQRCKSSTHASDQCYRNKPRGPGHGNKTAAKYYVDDDEDEQHSFAFTFEHGTLGMSDNDGSNEGLHDGSNKGLGDDGSKLLECLVVDSGATAHLCCRKENFSSFDCSFKPETHYIELADGTRSNNVVKARGNASVKIKDSNGRFHDILLKNALYVPSYNQNIFSVECATNMGATVHFTKHKPYLEASDGTRFNINKRGKLYYLNSVNVRSKTITKKSLDEWHNIYAHTNVRDVIRTEKCVDGMVITDKNSAGKFECDTCLQGKLTQYVDKDPDERATRPMQFISTDLAGPITPTAREGFRYVIMFTCNYSGCCFVYFLKHKSDAFAAFRKFLADSAPYGKIEILRSDSGGNLWGDSKTG